MTVIRRKRNPERERKIDEVSKRMEDADREFMKHVRVCKICVWHKDYMAFIKGKRCTVGRQLRKVYQKAYDDWENVAL